ncbi:carbon storage regulator [Thiolapillus sp.]|uniref:carbon storage regulator n=1 Tax=Thiolapillus sp. TaxID=2017437 RepID=UPI003AF8CEB1
MLLTKRSVNDQVKVGDDIRIVVVSISGNKVELGVKAPRGMRIDCSASSKHDAEGQELLTAP